MADNYRQVVAEIAALWQERRQANADDLGYSQSVSAPTYRDAPAIGVAIRLHRRTAGEVTNAACADKSRGILGNNGSVLEVRAIGAGSVTLCNAAGREGWWRGTRCGTGIAGASG